MKKKLLKTGVLLALVTLATIGTKVANNNEIFSIGLMFSNMEALASDSEGGSESGKSLCYSDCIKSTDNMYLPCGGCIMVDGIGNHRGGYCRW